MLSPAKISENFLQKSQLSPKNETNKIQQDFLNVSGVKTPHRRTYSESLLRSVLTSQSNTKSPITNRKRALSAFSKDLRYIVISSSGIHNFNTAKDSFILHRKNFTGSSYFDEVKIKCDIESFWSQKCHNININQFPDDELCDLSVIGDTVVLISKPIVNPIRRLFNGINNTVTKYFLDKFTLNTFTIIKSANELFRTNIKDVILDFSDTNEPVAILNIGEQFNLIVTPRDNDDFIYKIADVSCGEGSLTLLSPKMYKGSKIHIPHRSTSNTGYCILIFHISCNETDNSPKLNLSSQSSPLKAYHADKPAESSKHLIQQRDKNTGHGSGSNICMKYESNTNKKPNEEFPISHKNFLTKEHYQGAIMVKKKQDLIKMAKLCSISALGRVEDLKISLIQFIEGMSTFKTNSNFNIEIIDELTKHLNIAAIEEELSQLGVTPKGTVKEIRTLLAQTIEAKYIPNEGYTPRVSQSEPGSTIRNNIDAAATEFLVDKANTDKRYIIRNAEIRPPTDKEVEKKI